LLNTLCKLGLGYGRDMSIIDLSIRRMFIFGDIMEETNRDEAFVARVSVMSQLIKKPS
jgi:hypothetical protein